MPRTSINFSNVRECPVCGGCAEDLTFPYTTVYNGTEFSYLRCGGCDATYVDPIPSEADFEKMYSRANYHDLHYHEIRTGGQYAQSIKFLTRFGSARKSLLDFGCGNASFLTVAKCAGFECSGIEFERSAIENAKTNAGVDVFSLDEALSLQRRFEIIHMGDVFEHLPHPVETLRTLRTLLAPDGIFYIEGPLENHRSLVFLTARSLKAICRAMGHRTPGASAPTHLLRVNARSQLSFFTNRLGYKCLEFHIYETGWPYLSSGRSLSVPGVVKAGIGYTAVLASNVLRFGDRRIFGNRFRALLQPMDRTDVLRSS